MVINALTSMQIIYMSAESTDFLCTRTEGKVAAVVCGYVPQLSHTEGILNFVCGY